MARRDAAPSHLTNSPYGRDSYLLFTLYNPPPQSMPATTLLGVAFGEGRFVGNGSFHGAGGEGRVGDGALDGGRFGGL